MGASGAKIEIGLGVEVSYFFLIVEHNFINIFLLVQGYQKKKI